MKRNRIFRDKIMWFLNPAPMKKTFIIPLILMAFLLFFPPFPLQAQDPSHHELAAYYAPVWYQDTSNSNQDFITMFNYDGDWIGNNNWENFGTPSLPAYIYYSVIETSTNWFITYADFHPRDWEIINNDLLSHENDMEGVQVVVKKDGSEYGKFLLMETEAHGQFYQYTNDPTVHNGHEDIDGGVLMYNESHPKVFVEAKGHGVYAYDGSSFPGGDGVIYYYTGQAEVPSSPNDTFVGYDLTAITDDLWPRRTDIGNGNTYDDPFIYNGKRYSFSQAIGGAFDGDTYKDDAANPPWGWDDSNDGEVYRGDFFFDPAYTMSIHFNIDGSFSTDYIHNYFLGIGVDTVPPTGSIKINNDASTTTTTNVTLSLSAQDNLGVTQMIVSNDVNFTGAIKEAYSVSKNWTLTSGEGEKTVYAKFFDGEGNPSAVTSDSIIVDLYPPTGSVSINNGASTCSSLSVTLTLACNDGAGSGPDKMMVYNKSDFSGASWEAYTTSKSWTLASGSDGIRTVYAKFKDKAGRESSSVSDSINYIADSVAPTNPSVIINNDDPMTRSLSVTLSLSAQDNVGVTHMMVSNDPGFAQATKEAYSSTKSWILASGSEGERTLYAKFFDGAGNSSSVASDSISYVTSKTIKRLAGNDRYLTAIEISREGWKNGSAKVVLARGDMFPDALAGATLAAKEGAPILLTTSGSLSSATAQEIIRLKATGAIILGGEVAVSSQVVSDLKSKCGISEANIKRYGGANRYETCSKIAEALSGWASKTAVIATGENYPDALASASLAAYLKMPIILVGKSSVPSSAQSALKSLSINKSIIVGGEGVIASEVKSWLDVNGWPAERLWGSDRYGTAQKIAEYALKNGLKPDYLAVATGENFPDALSAGPFAGAKRAAIVLVRKTSIPEGARSVLNANKNSIFTVYIAGGTGVVSDEVKDEIWGIIK